MSDRKRAFEGGGDTGTAKKARSEATPSNGSSSGPSISAADLIAQKKAEIAAKIAAMKKNAPSTSASPAVPSPAASPAVPSPTSHSPSPSVSDDLARRVAEAKRRVAEAQSKLAVKDNPYMSIPQTGKKNRPPEPAQQGAGLKMAAHPLLLDNTPVAPQSKKDRYKPMQPKFASIKANVRNAPTPPPAPVPTVPVESKANPYASSAAAASDSGFEGAPRERVGRSFRFNPKGKYVQIANQVRQEAQLEQLKQRIAESARKAGLDTEFETLEKNIRREPPPAAEWWDAALLPNKNYDDILTLGPSAMNIRTNNSPITIYVQHPIPIPAPGEKNKAAMKPLKLTKEEQKKMRKQRRQAELQDKRDRIRMGLIPPDPPKVRLANLMKVLTSDAVQDPTRVEARVRREVAMRKHTHEKMNAERKLNDEQRREKIENKKLEEEKKGIYGAVFKVKTLSDPAHRFKVRKNAEQYSLTGVCILNPGFSMVYVEGAAKFIRQYKRLMLHRIAWTEPARERGGEDVEINEGDEEGGPSDKGNTKALTPVDGEEDVVSLEDNQCWLIWEGQLRDRAFSSFKPKSCPTDATAKEVLGSKLSGYWDQAKNWKPEEEELF
ncbi:PRP3-domain-containing protein [Wolfiporia cocos MD-104 SS10]|uniref:PRP3-domain-containing protein n=1 Tax=Wolfiporia cocos (strain MD-104) TaxID=742152 RepID=A0A2H3K9N5_WOLCO|nr:PRP3-domain-containing protein [Wolfiporia cocos MD-104 SS10]